VFEARTLKNFVISCSEFMGCVIIQRLIWLASFITAWLHTEQAFTDISGKQTTCKGENAFGKGYFYSGKMQGLCALCQCVPEAYYKNERPESE
jgi:hypothetical protein